MRLRMTGYCCADSTRIVTAPCGRVFDVCMECDNGINECTEGECQHVKH